MSLVDKALWRDFAKIVIPDAKKHRIFDYYYEDANQVYDLNDIRTVINLAKYWSKDGLVIQWVVSKSVWRVFVGFHRPLDHEDLLTAVIKAVIAADKEENS